MIIIVYSKFTDEITSLIITQVKGEASISSFSICRFASESVVGCCTMDSIASVKAVAGMIGSWSISFTCNLVIRCLEQ